MILSSRNNLFIFNFPNSFVPEKITERYRPYLNRIPGNIITEPKSFLDYSVQGVNLPGIFFDPASQVGRIGKTRTYRSSVHPQELFSKEFTITMQLLDGYINYWMMLDILNHYYDIKTKEVHLPDGFAVRILDSEGNVIVTAKMKNVLFQEISSLEMSFANNAPDFSTFDCTFVYGEFETVVELD